MVLKIDGTVWAWGSNMLGLLGDGTGIDKTIPQQVNTISNIKQISAGYTHNLALTDNGIVWSWGDNEFGQLGVGTTVSYSNTPVQINGISDIQNVNASFWNSLSLSNSGKVCAFGRNNFGQIGDGSVICTNNFEKLICFLKYEANRY